MPLQWQPVPFVAAVNSGGEIAPALASDLQRAKGLLASSKTVLMPDIPWHRLQELSQIMGVFL